MIMKKTTAKMNGTKMTLTREGENMGEQNKKGVFSSSVSENIWGHRFQSGQRGVEYVLEFLNVIAGTGYKLDEEYYQRKKMINFRQFVFEGQKDGASKKDGNKFVEFSEENKEKLKTELNMTKTDLEDVQVFFRNLKIEHFSVEGKQSNRSWFAETLFPLNESLLFFEVRRKNATVDYERNFFARGGELYYLMLTYGTKDNPELRQSIEQKLNRLMKGNKNIQSIVENICECLDEKAVFEKNDDYRKGSAILQKTENFLKKYPEAKKREEPTLPLKEKEMYKMMAEDLNALLSANIDIHEIMNMLTSLVCFHIYLYMIDQASLKLPESDTTIFVDCLDGQNSHIKLLAQNSFKDTERLVKECFDRYTDELIEKVLPEEKATENIKFWKSLGEVGKDAEVVDRYARFYEDLTLSKLQKTNKQKLLDALLAKTTDQAYRLIKQTVRSISANEQAKTQLSILRVLSRDGGFMLSSRGVPSRYIFNDELLSALVFAVLRTKEQMPFQDFKTILYERYNIVIGEYEAQVSGIYEREKINLRSFKQNETQLRSKLRKNGLLEEYSDATALIKNPYQLSQGGNQYANPIYD